MINQHIHNTHACVCVCVCVKFEYSNKNRQGVIHINVMKRAKTAAK